MTIRVSTTRSKILVGAAIAACGTVVALSLEHMGRLPVPVPAKVADVTLIYRPGEITLSNFEKFALLGCTVTLTAHGTDYVARTPGIAAESDVSLKPYQFVSGDDEIFNAARYRPSEAWLTCDSMENGKRERGWRIG